LADWEFPNTDLEDTQKLRQLLNSCVDEKKLSSLDEAIGTIVTLTAAGFALLALLFPEFQQIFGFAAIITTIFFWITYRIAKILHAIEIRFLVIISFFMFLFWFVYLELISFVSFFEGYLGTIFTLIFSTIGIILIGVICVKASNRIWTWLSNDSLHGWSPLSSKVLGTKDKENRESGFLVFMVVFTYGMYAMMMLIGGVNLLILTVPICLILIIGIQTSWKKIYEIWLGSLKTIPSEN
jgi:hypothetical protein